MYFIIVISFLIVFLYLLLFAAVDNYCYNTLSVLVAQWWIELQESIYMSSIYIYIIIMIHFIFSHTYMQKCVKWFYVRKTGRCSRLLFFFIPPGVM